MPDEASWIADGTTEVEPVTTETPADTETQEAAAEVVAESGTDTAESSEQPRDDHGRWVSGETEAAETTEVEATEAGDATEAETVEAETVEAEAMQAFIEAKLGDEPFQLPDGLAVPLKRGDETEYVPIDEVLKMGMRGKDYTLKTTEVAQLRRTLDREREEFAKQEARTEARAKYLEEQEAELRAAQTDPAKWQAYQEHLQQYQSNPYYRKNVDAALRSRETEAELGAMRESAEARVVSEASETAIGWIEGLASEFPGVDPERVRGLYAHALQSGTAQLSPDYVRRIYQSEKDYVDRTVSPLRSELDDLKATIASLQAANAAETHNQTTQHAVQRARAPKVNTGGGAPTQVKVAAKKFDPRELADRNQAWIEGA